MSTRAASQPSRRRARTEEPPELEIHRAPTAAGVRDRRRRAARAGASGPPRRLPEEPRTRRRGPRRRAEGEEQEQDTIIGVLQRWPRRSAA